MRRLIPLLIACLTLCLAGCSDQSDPDTEDSPVAVPSTGPATPTNLLTPSGNSTGSQASDPVVKGGETLAAGGHGLDQSNPLASDDPISKAHDLSSSDDPLTGTQSGERKVGWYWLRGTIENGHVTVSLNGAPCGDFTEFTDREVTRLVVPGINRVSFTSTPMSQMRPMTAHLILYMRAASANVHETVPAVIYNLSNTDPVMSEIKPSSSPDAVPVPAVPKVAAPETREMTFFAK